MLDLYHASRDDLIRIILSHRDALADRDRQLAAVRGEQAALSQVVKELTVQIGELRAVAAQDPGPPRATPPGMPGLKATEPVARTAPQLARLVGPVVEQVAQRLAQGQSKTSKPMTVPTLLSQTSRSDGRDRVRTTAKKEIESGALRVPNACRECETILPTRSRKYCDACLPVAIERSIAKFSESGSHRLAELRAQGREPSQRGEARRKRGGKNSKHMKNQAVWEANHGKVSDPRLYFEEILSKLQNVSLNTMAKATGLSQQYCSSMRRGLHVPLMRHWKALVQIAADYAELGSKRE